MKYSPKNIKVACDHKGLTHFGGVYFFHEFLRVMQLQHFLACHLIYPRRNSRYHLSQMIFALMYPIVLGLDRIETASFLRSNGTFQYLTGLPSFPDPQTLRRFLFHAPERFWEQLHRINDRLLQTFIHLPDHRSRLIFDLDSTVVTVFGHQDGAEVGYNPRYRGKRSYNPLLCMEANSSYLWDAELRRGNAGTWDSTPELLATCFANVPADIRQVRVRADAGFGLNPVFDALESHSAEYAVVARMTPSLKRSLTGLRYSPVNRDWEMAELQLRPQSWSRSRRFVVARRLLSADERQPTLFALGRYAYRAWVYQSLAHPSRRLAFLRCTRGHRTSHRRAAGRLRATQDSHPLLRRQCTVLGNHSPRLQSGHRLPTTLLARILATSHSFQAALQALPAARRTHQAAESSRTAAA